MVHGRLLYCDRPHARITRIDTTKARAHPGVVAVITQADVPSQRYGGVVADRTLFADGVVRFEGEAVAAVAALTREAATEAAQLRGAGRLDQHWPQDGRPLALRCWVVSP